MVLTLNHLGMLRAYSAEDIRRPGPLRRVAPVVDADVRARRRARRRPRRSARRIPAARRRRARAARHRAALGEDGPGRSTTARATGGVRDGHRARRLARRQGRRRCARRQRAGEPRPGDRRTGRSTPVDRRRGLRSDGLLWDGAQVWAAGSERVAQRHRRLRLGSARAAVASPRSIPPTAASSCAVASRTTWRGATVASHVVLVSGALCGIGRRGEVYTFDTRDGTRSRRAPPIADSSLGIAHAAARGDQVLFGFNRGGYRLYAMRVGTSYPTRTA